MTSTRHNDYLDAARASILDVGWKRTTLTDVARRADVSRMTIYRAWPDMQTLLADLMTREWTTVPAAVPTPLDHEPTPERTAAANGAPHQAPRPHHLFRPILAPDHDPPLPYLLARPGPPPTPTPHTPPPA